MSLRYPFLYVTDLCTQRSITLDFNGYIMQSFFRSTERPLTLDFDTVR